MRFIGLIFALLAAICLAQSQQNYINVPPGNFNAVAGQPITITWSNPSSGDVTIRLSQSGSSNGPVLVSSIPASAQTATFTIPSNVNMAAYNFAIVDDSNRNNINFSSAFTISGGTDTPASASASASATASSATASATASLSSLSSSASSARSSMSSSASSVSASASSAASSASASASSSASRASSSMSSSASSASAAATSVAASKNGCAAFGVSGAAAVLAAIMAVY